MSPTSLFIQPEWPAPTSIKAYTSLRHSGASLPPYDHFNLAFHVGDQAEAVKTNRQALSRLLHLPTEPIWLNQVHGCTVIEALAAHRGHEADASFARQANQVCAVMSADCLPILVCDQAGRQVAAIHAGWRGLAKGLIARTLKTFESKQAELLAWLGPAIGPQKFEVGEEVYQTFIKLAPANKIAFIPKTAASWLANIYELARLQLRALGVSQIYGGNYCTYLEADNFFSYRRDQGKTGRMASLIWIEA